MTERDFDTPVETPTVQPAPAQGAKPAQTVPVVAVVLAAAWFAAPHVLDWATHTWYTVVKDRDLEAESASRAAASSQAAASAAASEAASSAA